MRTKTVTTKKLYITLHDNGLCIETQKTGKAYKLFWLHWHKYFQFLYKRIEKFIHIDCGFLSLSIAW